MGNSTPSCKVCVFLDLRIRDYVSKGVRAVFPGDDDDDDPESATASLLAMFRPLDAR